MNILQAHMTGQFFKIVADNLFKTTKNQTEYLIRIILVLKPSKGD